MQAHKRIGLARLLARSAALCAAFLWSAASAPSALAQAGAVFDCIALEGQMFDDGHLAPTPFFDMLQKNGWTRFTFDEETGRFLWTHSDLLIPYTVVQHGNPVNGVVAVAQKRTSRSYSLKTLRIAAWASDGPEETLSYRFMLVDEDMVYTGFCRVSPPRKG